MIEIMLNGQPARFNVDGKMPLLWAVRDIARLTGTKYGFGMGLCGVCTVLIDGEPARACITPMCQSTDHAGKNGRPKTQLKPTSLYRA